MLTEDQIASTMGKYPIDVLDRPSRSGADVLDNILNDVQAAPTLEQRIDDTATVALAAEEAEQEDPDRWGGLE